MSVPVTSHAASAAGAGVHTAEAIAPVAIGECELTALPAAVPIAPLDAAVGVPDEVRLLVRWRGAPVGWMRLPGETLVDGAVPAETVAAMLVAPGSALAAALHGAMLRAAAAPNDAELPPISVVVCTRDRADWLARALGALAALDYPAYEVVVVDNASATDATERIVRARQEGWSTSAGGASGASRVLRYVREPRPGLDWARNRGLAEARHAIVAYTDDDVRVDRAWLRGVARALAEPDVVGMTGLVAPADLTHPAQLAFEDWYGGMGKGERPRWWRGPMLDSHARLGAHHLGLGANMAFRRDWLASLGGFDTALDVGTPSRGAGDLDVLHRTLARGGTIRYEPTALVWHHHRATLPALRRQLSDNGRSFGVYLLMRLVRGEEPRGAVVRYAVWTWLRWLALRVPRRFLRRERTPLPLQAAEIGGALSAPWAWVATRRRDRVVRAGAAEG